MTVANRITGAIFRHNRIAVILFLGFITVLAAGIPRLHVSMDSSSFFGPDNLEYIDALKIGDTYAAPNTVLLMVVPPRGAAFAPETLRVLKQMTDDAWQMPYALRVDTAINHMHTFAQNDEIFVEPLLDEFAEITPEAAARFGALAIASDGLRNRLLSENAQAYGIAINVVLPDDDHDEASNDVEDFVSQLKTRWRAAYPEWDVRASGGLMGNNLLGRVAVEDIVFLVPLALVAVVILFMLTLGSVRAVVATLAVLTCATVATLGFAGWINMALMAGTAISPLAVMVLVSTSCVHVILSTIRLAEQGTQANPFQQAIENNLAPVTISHLTTAFGFLCLNFAPSPPLANMGTMVAFGLVIGHGAVFILLPGLLSHHPPTQAGRLMVSGIQMRRLAGWVLRHSRLWLVLYAVAGALALVGITRIDFDDNVIRYFDQRYELRQDSDAIADRLTGLETLQFSFQAPEGVSVFDPEFLRAIDRFGVWLADRPNVVAVASLTDIIKDLNRSMGGDDPLNHTIAPTQQANAQLLMFYELSLPVGMDLNVIMDVDRTQTLLTATVRANHSAVTRSLAQEAETWLAQNEPRIATRAAGYGIAFARISKSNNAQMLYGFVTVLCLVSLTMVITLRSLRMGVISLVPNLVPALLAFGLWGLTIGDINLGSTVVTTMTFGIVVDDTVHFLIHYLRSRRRGIELQSAIEETFRVVGSSIMLTSISLIIGFTIMAASGFSINQHIGILTAVVIAFALLSDLLLLPAILKTFQGNQK